ncbi:MAG: SDR family oxidoreductase [Gammaproteobacteria bacterium]|jgi:NAD(P)-dependent dehydrogenase (short-subunit alcohol dehydrogenase family)|nr:SDR family oxidoreductase [Gammaproteobacteria bacterium]MDH3750806.1 SDR family oxidoreductase [Gammaproteobacteria bacterium]MDH3804373.1 SDR family oxidoreductase [Gammaproteobacteria bacterium]
MADPLRLYGLKALVTNAASGIGEAVSRTLIKHGATVLAVDTINSGVEQHFASVKGIDGHTANLTDATRMPALIEDAVDHLGGIDILVNDFPLQPGTPISDGDAALDKLLESRADLIMSICRSALPHLKKSPSGRIISVGFLRSIFAAKGSDAFATAEHDLAQITRAIGAETGEFGITANYIQPGAIMTPASRDAFRKDLTLRDFCIAHSAAQRLGEPVDVAKVALFLASDDAAFVSGTGVAVDGGRTGS